MKVKYYKQQINTHSVNQIEERERGGLVTESEISGLKPSRGKRVVWMGVGTKKKIVTIETAKRKSERECVCLLVRGQLCINQKQNKL